MATLNLMSWNVNGLRAAHRKGFLDWLHGAQPDVLGLQETKIDDAQIPPQLRVIDSYHAYFACAERKGYSGVALYSKRQPLSVEYGFGHPQFDVEGRTVVADFGDFVLFNVYFPNGKSSGERLAFKLAFYDAFLTHVDGLVAAGRNVIVCGDVNTAHHPIDLARPKANETESGFLPIERAWMDKLEAHGYVDTFRMFNQQPAQYTWWTQRAGAREKNVGWRIDYFFVNEGFRDRVVGAAIHPEVMGSDHCPISLQIEV